MGLLQTDGPPDPRAYLPTSCFLAEDRPRPAILILDQLVRQVTLPTITVQLRCIMFDWTGMKEQAGSSTYCENSLVLAVSMHR